MEFFSHYIRNYKKEAVFAPLFKLFEACLELLVPLIVARMIEESISRGNQESLVAMLFFLLVFALVGCGISLVGQYYAARAAIGVTKEINLDLYQKVLYLSQTHQHQVGTSRLWTRIANDTLQIQTGINIFLRLFLRAPIVVFGAWLMAFSIDRPISLLFFGMIVLLLVVVAIISHMISLSSGRLRQHLDGLVGLVREQLQGMRVIRIFGNSQREVAQFSDQHQLYQEEQRIGNRWSSLLSPLTYVIVNLTLVYLLWSGQIAVQGGHLQIGALVALVNYLLQILLELLKLVMVMTLMYQTQVSVKRVQEILNQPSEDLLATMDGTPGSSSAVLEVEELYFTYPESSEEALSGIDLQVPKGAYIGITGGTGSGKSTLLSLLAGMYPVSRGRLSLLLPDGQPPRHLKEWRAQFALVSQKPQLFSGTIRSNLSLGLQRSERELWQALETAQIAEVIRQRGGLDSEVMAFGRNFSGGQKQRLTIARALVQDAPILLLDDATSALDYQTEAALLAAIHRDYGHKTIIMVSQRLAALTKADAILLLEEGRQLAFGPHEVLLAENPTYRDFYQVQEKEGGTR